MSNHEPGLNARLKKLEDAFIEQSEGVLVHVKNTNTLAQQIHALLLVNTALVAALRDRSLLDVDQIRTKAVEDLSDEQKAGSIGLYVNAVLGSFTPAETSASVKAAVEQVRERARTRFTVFEGGQSDEEPER